MATWNTLIDMYLFGTYCILLVAWGGKFAALPYTFTTNKMEPYLFTSIWMVHTVRWSVQRQNSFHMFLKVVRKTTTILGILVQKQDNIPLRFDVSRLHTVRFTTVKTGTPIKMRTERMPITISQFKKNISRLRFSSKTQMTLNPNC